MATVWPAKGKARFRPRDLVFLEHFKLARYSLQVNNGGGVGGGSVSCWDHHHHHHHDPTRAQAVLQSLPQLILLSLFFSPLGPLHGPMGPQCAPSEALILVALAVACVNVLDKVTQSAHQVREDHDPLVWYHALCQANGVAMTRWRHTAGGGT